MKKVLTGAVSFAMAATMLAGCGKKAEAGGTAEDGGVGSAPWNAHQKRPDEGAGETQPSPTVCHSCR